MVYNRISIELRPFMVHRRCEYGENTAVIYGAGLRWNTALARSFTARLQSINDRLRRNYDNLRISILFLQGFLCKEDDGEYLNLPDVYLNQVRHDDKIEKDF